MTDAQGYDERTGWTGWIVFALVNDTWVDGWNAATSNAVVLDVT
jgi:hypothetical protein